MLRCNMDEASTDKVQLLPERASTTWKLIPEYKMRCIGSKAAVVILVMNLMLSFSIPNAVRGVSHFYSYWREMFGGLSNGILFILFVVAIIMQALYVFISYLSDTYCGRLRALRSGLWGYWAGTILQVIGVSGISWLVKVSAPPAGLLYVIVAIAVLVLLAGILSAVIGILIFYANVIQLGTDQLKCASGEEIGSFIHWFVWTETVGVGFNHLILYIATTCQKFQSAGYFFLSLVQFIAIIVLTFSLCGCCKIHIIEDRGNGYKTIFKVIRFSRKGGSGFSLNSSKTEHGGPFPKEQVEDVKSFIHIFKVVACISAGFLSTIPVSFVLPIFSYHLSSVSTCSEESILLGSGILPVLLVIIIIPVHEIVFYPLLRPYMLSALKRVGVGFGLFLFNMAYILILDIAGHQKESKATCMFTDEVGLGLDVHTLLVPNFINAIAYFLIQTAGLEFICSESPKSVKGPLVTIFLSLRAIFWLIGFILVLPFWIPFANVGPSPFSCGGGYYLMNIGIGLVTMAAYVFFARKYARYHDHNASNSAHDDTEDIVEDTAL